MSPNLHIRLWSDKAKMALIGLLTTLVVMLAVTALALGLSAIRDNRALKQAVSAHQLASVVNAERAATLERDCTDQNTRHDNTIKALNKLYQKPPAIKLVGVPADLARAFSKLRMAQTRASKAPTRLLIDDLVPHQDCQQLVRIATTPPLPK